MNAAHVHLLINHVAVIGSFLGIVVLLFGIYKKAPNTLNAAYTILIISAIGCVIAYLSGEGAEETVEQIAGVTESTIEPHEDAAQFTIVSFSILGILALIGLVVNRFKVSLQRSMSIAVLVIGILSCLLAARTAWLGGKIRHGEEMTLEHSNTLVHDYCLEHNHENHDNPINHS